MDMRMGRARSTQFADPQADPQADTMVLRYRLVELWEFERSTDAATAVRTTLGPPLEREPHDPASLPLIIVGDDVRRIYALLISQRREPQTCVRPIAVVGVVDDDRPGSSLEPLADMVLPPRPARGELLDAGRALALVNQRLVQVPLAREDRPLLLLQLALSRNQPFFPSVDAEAASAYDYPLADLLLDTGTGETMEILEDMARHGIFETVPVDRVFVCPGCHGYRVPVKELCPECHSSNLRTESSMHHFRCGYVAPESEFMVHGRPICPKCHASLRHIGVEYNRPGLFSVCHDCGHWVSEPQLRAWCVDCNAYHAPNELIPVHIKRFALSKNGVQIARAGTWDPAKARALGHDGPAREDPDAEADPYARELAQLLVDVAAERKHPLAIYRVVLPGSAVDDAKLVARVAKFLGRMTHNRDRVRQVGPTAFLVVLPRGRREPRDGLALQRRIVAKFHLQVQVSSLHADDSAGPQTNVA